MNKLIIFDFDNTLAGITRLHRQAWRYTLSDVGLKADLGTYLPAEKYSLERFDSANRVRRYFFQSNVDKEALEFFFQTNDRDAIVAYLLDLKESHLLYLLKQQAPLEMMNFYAKNIFPALDILLSNDYQLGIISSTRESVIFKALSVVRLDEAFQFILGEESLVDKHGQIQDKPNSFASTKIPIRYLSDAPKPYYVGDDARIDSAFANRCNFKYVQYDHSSDLIDVCKLVE